MTVQSRQEVLSDSFYVPEDLVRATAAPVIALTRFVHARSTADRFSCTGIS